MKKLSETEPSSPSLSNNFLWSLMGSVAVALSQWGMIIFMAKLGKMEMVGQFTLGLAIAAPVYMLTNLQLRTIMVTDQQGTYHFNQYLALRIITTCVGFALITFIAIVGKYDLVTSLIIIIIALMKGIECISDIAHALLQKQEFLRPIGQSLLIRSIISVMVLGALIIVTDSLMLATIGVALVWTGILILYDRSVVKSYTTLKPHWNILAIRPLLVTSLALGIVMMLISLNDNIPRYVIQQHYGLEPLGYFTSIAYIAIAGSMVINAIGQSISPRLAKYYIMNDKKSFHQLLIRFMAFGLVAGLIGVLIAWIWGDRILTLLYSSDYVRFTEVFRFIMIAAALGYMSSIMGYAITAIRLFKIQPLLFTIVSLFALASSLTFIPQWGLKGAAIALIITFGIQWLGGWIIYVLASPNAWENKLRRFPS